jgi:hypothetical protein
MKGELLLVLLMVGLYSSGLHGQASAGNWLIKGCVVDRTNEDPISFGTVRILGAVDTTVMDIHGCFTMSLLFDPTKDRYLLVVEYPGFERYQRRITRRDIEQGKIHRLDRMKFDSDPPVKKYRRPR